MEIKLNRKTLLTIFSLFALLGAGATLWVGVKRQQDIRQRAAVPSGGRYYVTLVDPATSPHALNQTFPTEIRLSADEPAVNKVAAFSLKLSYTYGGTAPELKVVDPTTGNETTSVVLSDKVKGTNWSCPTNHVSTVASDKKIVIEILCANTGEGLLVAQHQTANPAAGDLIATINFKATAVPATNPVVISFDQAESMVTRKEDGKDYLTIPNNANIRISEAPDNCAGKKAADVNCDGKVNLVDLTTVANNWGTSSTNARADVNSDGKVNLYDLTTVANNWSGDRSY